MYAALLNDELVSAVEIVSCYTAADFPKLKFKCPNCFKEVQLVNGQINKPFFRHQNLIFRTKETEEHLLGKKITKSALTAMGINAKLEVAVADERIRADIYVRFSNKLYGIEIQCAPLSTSEYRVRHFFYQKEQIIDIWVIGKRHFLKTRLKKIHFDVLRTNETWGNYLIEIDVQHSCIRLKYNLLQNDLNNECRYQIERFSLDEMGLQSLFLFKPKYLQKYDFDVANERNYLIKQIQRKSAVGLAVATNCYECGLTIEDIPTEFFIGFRKPGEECMMVKYLKNCKKKAEGFS